MFENYEKAKTRKPPPWATPLIVTALVVHAAILMIMWIKSIWAVEKLELPKGRISLSGQFAPPPPPPPPPGGKKPEDVKKEPKKKKVDVMVQPVTPDKIEDKPSAPDVAGDPNGVEGGEEGGVEGGVVGGVVEAPKPPPPAPPQNVAPTAVEALRTSGEKQIKPDDVTAMEIQRSGKAKMVASFKICLDTGGNIQNINMLKSSGFPAYDSKLQREMRATWKYRPFLVNGKAAPVCTAVTFIYTQK